MSDEPDTTVELAGGDTIGRLRRVLDLADELERDGYVVTISGFLTVRASTDTLEDPEPGEP